MATITININHQEEISQRQLRLMKKGFKLGTWKINRDELHEHLC